MAHTLALLRAAEKGDAEGVARLARQVASGVLAADVVRLAFEVMTGSDVATKAIDLARLLTEAANHDPPTNEG